MKVLCKLPLVGVQRVFRVPCVLRECQHLPYAFIQNPSPPTLNCAVDVIVDAVPNVDAVIKYCATVNHTFVKVLPLLMATKLFHFHLPTCVCVCACVCVHEYNVLYAQCMSDLSLRGRWLPQGAQHHVGPLHQLAGGVLAVEPAQGVVSAHPVPLRDPGHGLGEH